MTDTNKIVVNIQFEYESYAGKFSESVFKLEGDHLVDPNKFRRWLRNALHSNRRFIESANVTSAFVNDVQVI